MNFLAVSGAWSLDIIFFVLILLGLLLGTWRGFVKGIVKLAGTFFAIIVAVGFCVPMENSLEKSFGMTTAIAKGIGNATVAGWLGVAISFVALVILVKLGAWLIGKLGTSLVERFAPLRVVNRILGALLGLVKALIIIFILLAIFKWLSIDAVNTFIRSSYVVKHIYDWKWFEWAMHIPSALK